MRLRTPPRSRTRGSIRQAKRGERGPQKKPGKVFISLRVEAGTVEAFKAGGRGYKHAWQQC